MQMFVKLSVKEPSKRTFVSALVRVCLPACLHLCALMCVPLRACVCVCVRVCLCVYPCARLLSVCVCVCAVCGHVELRSLFC